MLTGFGSLVNSEVGHANQQSRDLAEVLSPGLSQRASSQKKMVLGNSKNFWLWDEEDGFNLTHPDTPTSDPVTPRIHLEAFNAKLVIAPQKTALVVVDFQNNWLSEPWRSRGPAHDAKDTLLKCSLPAARKAGIQVVWLNWGLTDEGSEHLTPSIGQ